MSVSVATEPAAADDARESHALAFKIAFAAAVGLTLGELLGWGISPSCQPCSLFNSCPGVGP